MDVKDGFVAINGWKEVTDKKGFDFCKWLRDIGVKTVIYTDISRDGTLSGVNADASVALAKASGLSVVVSGGVSSMEGIKTVNMHEKDGLVGVIAGKAIYTGALDLKAAIAFVGTGD